MGSCSAPGLSLYHLSLLKVRPSVHSYELILLTTTLFLCSRYYLIMVAMFFTVSVVNNYALNLNIAMPLHMIFRSVSTAMLSFPTSCDISSHHLCKHCLWCMCSSIISPPIPPGTTKSCAKTKFQLNCGESNLAVMAQL